MRTWTICILVGCGLLAGCGGDDENLAEPRLIAGGGVGDGAIAGRVNVHVIDSDTDEPVGGAQVLVGEPGEEPLEGLTDSSGLFTIDDGALDGPTTITVVADGYVVATWFGANGANVTIPIDPEGGSSAVPQATLRGTIAGWDSLPDPATDHFIVGLVNYSYTDDLGDPANEIPQGTVVGGLPANACVKSSLVTECDWALNSRTGKVAVFAIIIDIDTKGNADDSDDTSEVIGFAYKPGITVEDGVDQTGLSLTQLDVGAMTEMGATVASAPSGITDTSVVFGLDVGEDGIMMVGFLDDPDQDTIMVPDLAGDFASDHYIGYAFAGTGADDPEDDDPMSAILQRDITDLSADVDFGDWLALPSELSADGGEYSFTPVDGAALHTVAIQDAQGNAAWAIALLDGRASFALPGLSPDPLPSGDAVLLVSALIGDVDLQDFAVDDFQDVMDQLSRARLAFTP